jgi:acetyl-CoA acetyltransferase
MKRYLGNANAGHRDTNWMRTEEGLGIWPGRGKVTIQGWGLSDITPRWDGKSMGLALGALAMSACERAMEDAGVAPEEIDGLLCCPYSADGSGGPAAVWGPRPYFDPPYDSEDGISIVTGAWLLENMKLPRVKFAPADVISAPHGQMGQAAQAVADGLCETALVVYPMATLEGAYRRGGAGATSDYASGSHQWRDPWGPSVADPIPMQQYCTKYGTSWEEVVGRFVVNQHRNGLLNPWNFYSKYGSANLTLEKYSESRPVIWPLRIWDCDRPMHVVTAYLFTTPERARNMRHKPVYVINHNEGRIPEPRSTQTTLDEVEEAVARAARLVYQGSGWKPSDVDIFNPYDGFATFVPPVLEAFQWHGVQKGDAPDFFKDIRIEGPHPFSPGGGNLGNGRTRSAMFIDSIDQLRGTAGERQVKVKAETAIASSTHGSAANYLCLSSSPD